MLGTNPVFSSTWPMRSCRSGGSWSRAGTANLLTTSVIAHASTQDQHEVDAQNLPVLPDSDCINFVLILSAAPADREQHGGRNGGRGHHPQAGPCATYAVRRDRHRESDHGDH